MEKRHLFVFIACFISFLGYIGGSIYISALPEMSIIFQTSSALVKFSITIYFLGLMIGTLASGPLSEIYGRKQILVSFLLLAVFSELLCAVSLSITTFLVGRLLQGIGQVGGPILIMAIISDSFKGKAYNKMMSAILVVITLAPGMAPGLGSIILHFLDWRDLFYILAFFDLLAFLLVIFVKIDHTSIQIRVKEAIYEYLFFLKHPFFRYYCLMIGSLYGALYAFLVMCPYVFRIDYGWHLIDFTWIGVAIAFANSFGSMIYKNLVEKLSNQRAFLFGLVVTGFSFLGLLLIGVPSQGQWIVVMVAFFMFGDHIISACLTANALKMGEQYSTMASSLINFSKVSVSLVVLMGVLFIPANLTMIKLSLFLALLVCLYGFLKILKNF